MNKEVDGVEPDSDDEDLDEFDDTDMADTVVLQDKSDDGDDTDNVGDASVELNVEELIAELEQSDGKVSARQKEVRRRLEELAEEGSFEDTYAIEFDKP